MIHAMACSNIFLSGSRPPTESNMDVEESALMSNINARNAVMFADGNKAWRRAALDAQIEFHQVKHVLLEFAKEVRRSNGSKVTAGTQTLDKCWDYAKNWIPNSVKTKDQKHKMLNAEVWNHIYQWQWRYNNRFCIWQTVPLVLKELAP